MNGTTSYAELFDACRVLFGPEIDLSVDFLQYLHFDGVKAAFRRKAKETHPDLSIFTSSHDPHPNAESFHRVNDAYALLGNFIRNRRLSLRKERSFGGDSGRRNRQPGGFGNTFHRGAVPERPLPLGRYLYYRGVIPYLTLLDALTWQRRNRATIGSIAREWGWLSHSDVEAVLAVRQRGRFGENAVRCGLLNPFQVTMLLLNQKSRNRRIGHYFVLHDIVSSQQLEMLARDHYRHNLRFGNR